MVALGLTVLLRGGDFVLDQNHCLSRYAKLSRYCPFTLALHQNRSPYPPIYLH
jgi:hypothetical protein